MSMALDAFANAAVEEDSNRAKKVLGDEGDLCKKETSLSV